VIVKMDGTTVKVNIGEDDNDPVFTVTDLLIHLAGNQMSKKANVVIEGESLDLLVGSQTLNDVEKDNVKANVLRLLKEKYDVEEEDFLSAELELVPADKARDLGFDRSMILAYGQDDKICAWTSLFAMLDIETPDRTACTLLVDKEEIGSVGASGMHSKFFENTTAELMALMGFDSDLSVRRAISRSKMLSSDVSAGYDPLYADVFESKNAAFLGKGIVFNKFTGSRGKSGSNDANAEYIAAIRNVMAKNNVQFQTAELGKVDVGGGGTIAYIMANYGMEVIDAGLAVLCMHSPQEVCSKVDVFEAVRAYKAFLKDMK
ncbi:MAG TPA: aminopeptidase, partial [Kandleria vitulina]|nr:aminopeptidase [Kandleria vitulina]